MSNQRYAISLFIGVIAMSMVLLAGCGQKGPLYLPDEKQQEKEQEKKKKTEAETKAEPESETENSQ